MKHDNCLVCERIALAEVGKNPDVVVELETGWVVIGWHQFFKGYTLFMCKQHKNELHELDRVFKMKFLEEMSLVAEAVCRAFEPVKMNYELLGNSEAHLHWHLFPRHADDPNLTGPVWEIGSEITHSDDVKPSPEELEELKRVLRGEIGKLVAIKS